MATLKGGHSTRAHGPVASRPPRRRRRRHRRRHGHDAVGARSGFQLSLTYSKTSPIAGELLPTGFFDPLVRVMLVATLRGVPTVLADGPIKRQDVTATGGPGRTGWS